MSLNMRASVRIRSLPGHRWVRTARCLLLLSGATAMTAHGVENVEFNPAFFPNGANGKQVDVSRFSQGNVVLPGSYRVDVYLNGQWIGRETLSFVAVEGRDSAQMCLEREALVRFGIDLDAPLNQPAEVDQPAAAPFAACEDVASYLPGSHSQFDPGENRLTLQVPQVYLARQARGYVDPKHWDSGVDAAFVRYNANTFAAQANGRSINSHYLGVNSGLNLGEWHWRHNGSFSRTAIGSGYQSSSTYVQRELSPLRSQLVVGEIFTPGELFDSVRLRGASLFSDDRMLPDSQTGFAPVVRGIAETNARVTVRQRGVLLDEVSVAPGPFVLNDLFPTGYGGDLTVTVTEADGRQREFIVPFAANANLLRAGYSRYALSVGQLDEIGLRHPPTLMQATYQHGLSNLLTGYTGAVVGEDYQSQLVGAAFNTPLGALSLDLTNSSAKLPGHEAREGRSVQLRYSKNFTDTGTHFALGAYRYSTEGFLSVADAARVRGLAIDGLNLDNVSRLRDRMDISLNQSLGNGSVYLTGSSQNYWNRKSGNLTFTTGYTSSWKGLHYTVSAQRTKDLLSDRVDKQVELSLSFPLGSGARSPTLTSAAYRGNQSSGERVNLGGSLGERSEFTYGVGGTRTQGSGNATSADMKYQASHGVLSAGYGQSNSHRAASFGMTGGVVVHAGGVTFAPELGDTLGIVQASDAQGARINGNHGAQVGGNGYAIVPHLTPYRQNVVELDPKDLSVDVELKTAAQNVAPRAGSVVKLHFDTVSGQAILITALREDGGALPFGSDVFDEDGASVGIVGQGGKAFVRVARTQGRLTVKWGADASASCRLQYGLDTQSLADGSPRLRHLDAGTCVTPTSG
ncbi:fimbria/pilus outer membrane usher protein [Pseudomonas lurida]|uniref:fimbria/pilus outer membrane usher protein n=1 Tax=Pseudomonas lurida TaxID=244566 RepID=UPI0016444C25|nr:fimbria/pilus outer membrane usher protein [Pseudomonas lurida]MBC3233637.1 fimbrial biogenesis outer membrane usher protein [Pseudomonas lurida]MBC3241975.1 fimbrial biogenesis outer membrane usher protein [Pseudomonas lurida]MBC3923422.1 fimbrial biogenesis outer membrane usher protein [Pseudomonas lurida]MBD8670002.1 fimbrial biogenesis outer membrane usher protein [Pseudomonas lurida]UZQ76999.1 fimbrial biogenesis outer membrane usher protein [Pseudomonas lurida]